METAHYTIVNNFGNLYSRFNNFEKNCTVGTIDPQL